MCLFSPCTVNMSIFIKIGLTLLFINGTVSRHINRSLSHESIVGGYDTTIEEHPWQVVVLEVLGGNQVFICGGAILSTKYVLTAAHCLNEFGRYRVGFGVTQLSDRNGTIINAKPIVHPGYMDATNENDIGLLVLDKKIMLDGVKTKAVNLPRRDEVVFANQDVVVTGWGTLKENGNNPRQLQEATVRIVNHKTCVQMYSVQNSAVTQDMICAGLLKGGKDSCQGDSGGPLVVKESQKLVGIVSWGIGCAKAEFPGVYTNVAYFRDWIKATTGI